MKIALCLHGLVGTNNKYGHGNKNINYKIGHQHFKNHVIDVNENVDVFIHTWSENYKDKLAEIYNPVAIKTEPQPSSGLENLPLELGFATWPHQNFPAAIKAAGLHANYCRWKSVKEVMTLVNNSNTKYDWILLTRFDIAFLVDFDFSKYDNSKFYAQGPVGPNEGGIDLINDLWFFSNQEKMSTFSKLFDNLGAFSMKKNGDLDIDTGWQNLYSEHYFSNHRLARIHLQETGIHDDLEYLFKREWTGAAGKLSSDTPLVRWHYMKKV